MKQSTPTPSLRQQLKKATAANEKLERELAKVKAQLAAFTKAVKGQIPLAPDGEDYGSSDWKPSIEQRDREVSEFAKANGCDEVTAVRVLSKQRPHLWQQQKTQQSAKASGVFSRWN